MNFMKLMLVVCIAFAGYKTWQKHSSSGAVASYASPDGFVPLEMVVSPDEKDVVIFAPKNCPKAAGKRADNLEQQLLSKGMSVKRLDHFSVSNVDAETANRINAVMSGELPIVFVKGKGKANPNLDEVLAQYRANGS